MTKKVCFSTPPKRNGLALGSFLLLSSFFFSSSPSSSSSFFFFSSSSSSSSFSARATGIEREIV